MPDLETVKLEDLLGDSSRPRRIEVNGPYRLRPSLQALRPLMDRAADLEDKANNNTMPEGSIVGLVVDIIDAVTADTDGILVIPLTPQESEAWFNSIFDDVFDDPKPDRHLKPVP